MKFLYKFTLDIFATSYLAGWVCHRFTPQKNLTLLIKEDDTILGECVANLLREDVKNQNLHPTGHCGFSFQLPTSYTNSKKKGVLSLIVKESNTLLATIAPHMQGQVLQAKVGVWNRFTQKLGVKHKKNKIFFMHIPKTAGTSFNSFARSLYKPKEILTHIEAYDHSTFHQIAADYRFISGHLRMDSVHNYFNGADFQLYTLVREPYAQLHSHLNWLRGIGANPESDFYKAHHGLFKDLADQFGDKTSLTNDTLQIIVDNISGVLSKLLDNNQSRHFLSSDPEVISENHWGEIQDNLNLFTLAGTTKNYAKFREDFCFLNSFEKPKQTTPLNASKYTPLYDYNNQTTQEIVHPLVTMDLQLYKLVQKQNTLLPQ